MSGEGKGVLLLLLCSCTAAKGVVTVVAVSSRPDFSSHTVWNGYIFAFAAAGKEEGAAAVQWGVEEGGRGE